MASTTTLPVQFQVYDTFGRWQYTLPTPSVLSAAPTTSTAGTLGTIAVVPTTSSAYCLVASNASGYIWEALTGGSGSFSSLTVFPGPTNLNVASAQDVDVLTGASSGNIHLNDGTGTGTIGIGNAAAGNVSVTSGGDITLTSVLNILAGNTNINNSLNHNVNINTGTSTGTATIGNVLATVAIDGATSINASVNAATNINTGTSTGVTTIGNVANGGGVDLLSGAGVTVSTQANTIASSGLILTQGANTAQIITGSGAPTNGVTLGVQGSLYINVAAATAATRLYIATGLNTWTNFTAAT